MQDKMKKIRLEELPPLKVYSFLYSQPWLYELLKSRVFLKNQL